MSANNRKATRKVKDDSPKTPGGAFPVLTPHLLYRDWQALKVDGRSFYAKRKKELIGKLLDHFKPPVPGTAEILANITAANLLLALRLEGLLHTGKLAPSAFQDYLRLTNSNSANLVRLWNMAKDGAPGDQAPDLREYLAMLQAAAKATPIHQVEAEGAGPDE